MNNDRRKRIAAISEKLEELHAELEGIQEEEQEAFDSMPESLQQGDRGQQAEQAADALSSAASSLEELNYYLATAQE